MKHLLFISSLAGLILFSACKKNDDPKLIFRFKFDPSQKRLNNLGQVSELPNGHAGQSPKMREMSAHYIELAPTAWTQVGNGEVLYTAPE